MRQLVAASVRVSPEEVQHRYQTENNKVDIAYVAFPSSTYRDDIELTPADIDAYLAAHDADLKAQYDKDAARWKGREKEVRVRDIYVKSEKAPTPALRASLRARVLGARSPRRPGKPDAARAKADAALAKIKGGQDFAAVAKATSEDPRFAKRGGDLGWRPLRALRLGESVSAAVTGLKKGDLSDVLTTPDSYVIVQLLDSREGDLTYDQVKRDLAEEAARDDKAKAAAKADADKAFAAAKAGTPIDKQFPNDASTAQPGAGKQARARAAEADRHHPRRRVRPTASARRPSCRRRSSTSSRPAIWRARSTR